MKLWITNKITAFHQIMIDFGESMYHRTVSYKWGKFWNNWQDWWLKK